MSRSAKERDAAVARAKKALAVAEKGLGLMTADAFLAGMQKRAQAAQHRIRAAVARKNTGRGG